MIIVLVWRVVKGLSPPGGERWKRIAAAFDWQAEPRSPSKPWLTTRPSPKVRRKLEATSEIPRLEKTTGRDGRSRPATTSRAPSQKAGGIAGRTVTAEVDPAASAERRKQEYTADESEREAMTAKDAALRALLDRTDPLNL
jgi:hypothetical protein